MEGAAGVARASAWPADLLPMPTTPTPAATAPSRPRGWRRKRYRQPQPLPPRTAPLPVSAPPPATSERSLSLPCCLLVRAVLAAAAVAAAASSPPCALGPTRHSCTGRHPFPVRWIVPRLGAQRRVDHRITGQQQWPAMVAARHRRSRCLGSLGDSAPSSARCSQAPQLPNVLVALLKKLDLKV